MPREKHGSCGVTDLGSAVVSGGGWIFTTAALADGSHNFAAKATDIAGNSSFSSAVSAVIDTTSPVLTPVSDNVTEATSHDGAPVSFTATANDTHDGSETVLFSEGGLSIQSGDVFALGTHTIMASATDAAGNTSTETFTITIQDTTDPTITVTADATAEATGAAGAAVAFSATASDAVDGGADTVTFKEGGNAVASGAMFSLGSHTITATTEDAAGNVGATDFSFTVVDSIGPTIAINSMLGTNSGLTPTISSGGLTRDNTVALSGTVSDSVGVASVHVFNGAIELGAATISGNT